MKIAILLSGLPRMWQPSIATQIAMFPGHQVDVFFHFWDTIEAAEKEALLAVTKPKAYLFEPPVDFSFWDKDPELAPDSINVPSRAVSQYYSWRQVANLFDPHVQNYDVALRTRADLQFVSSVEPLLFHLIKANLVLPWWEEGKFLSDIFAFGHPQDILFYHTLYDGLAAYKKEGTFNPEILLQTHLTKSPTPLMIRPEKQSWYFIRRPHMADYTIAECMAENPGRNKWLDPEVLAAHQQYHVEKNGRDGATSLLNFYAGQLRLLLEERAQGNETKQ